ncbi:Na+-transporting methylmalonyl-CoA/oxaloacetate decarboxylase gamma subunit [Sporosarcina luteola]|nr:Na+-transporting methylmalonyl-CoA/oxaloacetate decarboxylase gamma subunit [Sporosarcina luteola]
MATGSGIVFFVVILLLMALFAISVVISYRRQRHSQFDDE